MYRPVWRVCRTIYGRKNKYIFIHFIVSYKSSGNEMKVTILVSILELNFKNVLKLDQLKSVIYFSDSKLIRLAKFSDCVDKTGSFCSFCVTYNI